MTTPTPRNHTEKPSTPPAGPSGVSHQPVDTETRALRQLGDILASTLRKVIEITGTNPCHAALHRVGAGDPPGGFPCSLPLGHDGKHVTESGRAWADPTDQQIRYVVDVVADVRANGGTVEIDGVRISRIGETR
ncbi:hypothetical protein KNV15_gp73 [Gordonia phage Jambalaya]|uniref:Uncharacterized protein n=1 Tax=Gordonia phage Jambalaya TaxID=2743985 RepID=A0A7D5JSW0_9CAUD|nr:hypothetical protein KNV15_gp73 [Gordonia phage Jambalaya]QLF84119.1 hypothetical protein SEA_JAMBALAYA_73 [Gordonia phage Jambalaya]